MKITDVKTHVVRLNICNTVIVQVETDAGITGVSEALMKRKSLTIEQSILELKRYLVGKDPTEIETHWERMYRDSFWVGGPMHCTSISAIDIALWDILGKSVGLPVYKLLGGPTRQQVPIYCHCPAGATPEIFAENIKACKARGYLAIKTTLPLFYGAKRPSGGSESRGSAYSGTHGEVDARWKETELLNPSIFGRIREFFLAAREAGGPEFGLSVDCHGRLNPKQAIRLCRELEDINLLFLEEPVPPEGVEELCLVQRETAIPIAAGERWATIYGVRPFLDKHAVDILQCDIVNCGGFTGMKKIAALAEAHYISMAPHNPNGPVATMSSLNYAAAIPNFLILETVGSEADEQIAGEFLKAPLRMENGHLPIPCGPGLGFELNDHVLETRPRIAEEGTR
ncbi:MAG: mandelate racemase/muconate lactonizing enzyme family protein [Acidobacteriota bacterium]|nr:mandelate racemase/muconate lactonizing enzyme family protein [Acidobacteriota bacterium]